MSRRAYVYTRPGGQQMVVAYYGHDDMGQAEREPPFNFATPEPK